MKFIVLLFALLAVPIAHGAEGSLESHFLLPTAKCEVEENERTETSPQSPPLNVDDPGTPGCNKWEINVTADGDVTGPEKDWELPLLDVNYGIGDNVQLKYEVPIVNRQVGGGSTSTVGESKAGIKYMFYDNDQSKVSVAIYPQMSFALGSRVVQKGLTSPGSVIVLPVLLAMKIGSTPLGAINLTANLGYHLSSKADTASFISAAVGVGMPIHRRIALMGELETEQAIALDAIGVRGQILKANIGFLGAVSQTFSLFASLGHSLYSSDLMGHTYLLVGVRILAG